MSKYTKHRASRRSAYAGRQRRLQREHRASVEPPVKAVGRCAGCLRDLYPGTATYTRGAETYCSSECLLKGRHWIDPSRCGGCHGEHRLGVRP